MRISIPIEAKAASNALPTLLSLVRARTVQVRALAVTIVVLVALLLVVVLHVVRSAGGGNAGGITLDQFNAVAKGESEVAVKSKLGTPLSQQDVEYPTPPVGDSCIYYFDSAGELQGGSTFRLCFKGGVLDFKDGSGADFPD